MHTLTHSYPYAYTHAGVAGLYDFGLMGCAMNSNLLSLSRHHFVLEEGMLEIDSCILTPEPVLKSVGGRERQRVRRREGQKEKGERRKGGQACLGSRVYNENRIPIIFSDLHTIHDWK